MSSPLDYNTQLPEKRRWWELFSVEVVRSKKVEKILFVQFLPAPFALEGWKFTGSGWQDRAYQQNSNPWFTNFKKFSSFLHSFPFWLVSLCYRCLPSGWSNIHQPKPWSTVCREVPPLQHLHRCGRQGQHLVRDTVHTLSLENKISLKNPEQIISYMLGFKGAMWKLWCKIN